MAEQKLSLDAAGVYYRELNQQIRDAVAAGVKEFEVHNVKGQRYLFTGVQGKDLKMLVHGTPGQDMAAFMNGPSIRVEGNAQDGVANTMDDGRIVINGMAGDVLGYGMRGGRLFIRGDVGYRVGIHMKAYEDKVPVMVVGGKAGDFLGEYMAGGAIVLLGMYTDKPYAPVCGRSLGTGMHGGTIYVRGPVPEEQLSFNLLVEPIDDRDRQLLTGVITDFAAELGLDPQRILNESFHRIRPKTHRPYGNMYVPC